MMPAGRSKFVERFAYLNWIGEMNLRDVTYDANDAKWLVRMDLNSNVTPLPCTTRDELIVEVYWKRITVGHSQPS